LSESKNQENAFSYNKKNREPLSESIIIAATEAAELLASLNSTYSANDPDSSGDSDSDSTPSQSLLGWPLKAARDYLSNNPPTPPRSALLFAFLTHTHLLQTMELSLRSQPAPSLPPDILDLLTTEFLPEFFKSLQKTIPDDVDGAPSIDGRIYGILLNELIPCDSDKLASVIGQDMYKAVLEQWTDELEQPPVDFGALRELVRSSQPTPKPETEAISKAEWQASESYPHPASPENAAFQEFALYPFTAPVLSEVLSPQNVQVPTKAVDEFGGGPEPLERFGPHSDSIFVPSRRHVSTSTRGPPLPRHLGGEQPRPKDRWGLSRMLRKNQRDMVHIERQASSLIGVKGAKLEAEVITPTGIFFGAGGGTGGGVSGVLSGATSMEVSREGTPMSDVGGSGSGGRPIAKGKKGVSLLPASNHASAQSSPAGGKGGKGGGKKAGGKGPPMKSADKLRAQIESQKKAKVSSDAETWWRNRLEELKNISDLKERIEMIELQLKNNKRLEDPSSGGVGAVLAAQVWLYRINCECWHWVENPRRAEREVKDQYVVKLLKMVMGMKPFSASGQNLLTPTMVKCLWSVLEVLGFEEYIQIIPKPTKEVVDKKLEWDFIKFYKKAKPGANAGG